MINLPFLTKTNKEENSRFLAVNINSDFVRCLVLYKEGGVIKVLGVGKQELDPGKVRAGSIIHPDAVAQALEGAATKALAEVGGGEINDMILGVSGDLCLGLMTTVKAKRGRSQPITSKEIDELNEKISDSAYLQAQNEYMQINGSSENELESVTSSNVYAKIDNQKVASLEDKTGSVIEMAVFNAFVPAHHLKSLQKVADESDLRIMAIGSEMYCLVKNILSSGEGLTDFIVVEIDGDYTTAAVVFGKGIVATRTLNVGYKHFVEGVSERMGLTMHEAEHIVKSYMQGKLTNSEVTIVQNALRNPLEIWLSGLELLFAEYSGVKTFPPKMFFTGEGADVTDLWNMLTTNEWTKSIPFKATPEFKKLSFMDITGLSDSTGKITSSEWIPTASLSTIKLEMDIEEND
jgi:cell division ATPase FtsA